MADELETPSPQENPLAPVTPPVVSELMEHSADAGAASLASVEALLTLHREQTKADLERVEAAIAALPATTAAAIRAEVEAGLAAAETAPEAVGLTGSPEGSELVLETPPAPLRVRTPRGLRLRR